MAFNNKEYLRKWKEAHPNYDKEWNEKHPMVRAAYNRIHSHNQNDTKYGRGKGNLTVEWYVENILSKPCVHCGETDWRKLGCNRIDNSKPHTIDNVEPCCRKCNMILGNKDIKSKRVDQIDSVTGEIIKSFQSAREASRQLGFNQSNISSCCRGDKTKYKGYKWLYTPL